MVGDRRAHLAHAAAPQGLALHVAASGVPEQPQKRQRRERHEPDRARGHGVQARRLERGHEPPPRVPPEVAGFIAKRLSIPVFGIGGGADTDGQVLIVSDMIGQFQAFTPKFVKKYCNVAQVITDAMKDYVADVKAGQFPADEHCYHMLKDEVGDFPALMKEFE